MAEYVSVVLDGWQFRVNPTEWRETYEDLRLFKRAINGTMNRIGNIVKKRFRFRGWSRDYTNDDVATIENRYKQGQPITLTSPDGTNYTVFLIKFEKIYDDKVVVKYEVEAVEQ